MQSTYVLPFGPAAKADVNTSTCHLSVCSDPVSSTLVIVYKDVTVALDFDEV